MRKLLLLSAVLWTASSATAAELRTWNDNTGTFKVQAELIKEENDSVSLKKQDGQVISVPMARLSKADIEYLKQLKIPAPVERKDIFQEGGVLVDDLLSNETKIELKHLVITAEPKTSVIEPKDGDKQPDEGFKFVVLDIDVTSKEPTKFATRQFALRHDGKTYSPWGLFGNVFYTGIVLYQGTTKTEFSKAGSTAHQGLVFMIPKDADVTKFTFLWDQPVEE